MNVPQFFAVFKEDDSVLIGPDGIAGVRRTTRNRQLSSLYQAIGASGFNTADGHAVTIVGHTLGRMNPTTLRIATALLVCGTLVSTGCATKPARINHVVFIELRDDSEQEALIADCNRLLRGIPGVATYWCGTHGDYGRTGIDADYDIALCIGFVKDDDYASYLVHPAHVELLTRWKPEFEWIRIHDVVVATR